MVVVAMDHAKHQPETRVILERKLAINGIVWVYMPTCPNNW